MPLDQPEETVLFLELDPKPVSATQIKAWTRCDPILAKVYQYTASGWPEDEVEEPLKTFASRKAELSLEDGVVLWGARVVGSSAYKGSAASVGRASRRASRNLQNEGSGSLLCLVAKVGS